MFVFIFLLIIGYCLGFIIIAPELRASWSLFFFLCIGLSVVGVVVHTSNRLSNMKQFNRVMKKGAETLSRISFEVPKLEKLEALLSDIVCIDIRGVLDNVIKQDMDIAHYKQVYDNDRATFDNIVNKVLCYDGYIVIVPERFDFYEGLRRTVEARGEDAEKYLSVVKQIGEQMNVQINRIKDWRERCAHTL